MRLVKKSLGIGALVLSLASCGQKPREATNFYVDLNRDRRLEVVTLNHGSSIFDYDLTVQSLNPDGSYSKPKLLRSFEHKPHEIKFIDLDGDEDLDMTYSIYTRILKYDTFVVKNNGEGKFSEPELINRQQ